MGSEKNTLAVSLLATTGWYNKFPFNNEAKSLKCTLHLNVLEVSQIN